MQRKEEETNQCKPKEVKQEKVFPKMFRVDVLVPTGMQLDHFRPDGQACFVVDPATPGPTIPSKNHRARARKKAEVLMESIYKKKKGRCNKKINNLVPIVLEETT